jgi:ATP-dependent DNA helicase RecG
MSHPENILLQLIAQGENASLEFKRDEIAADGFAKEVVAMLNRDGGTILIGVEDDGSISGVTKINEEWISNIARNNIIPAANLNAEWIPINGRHVLKVDVPKGQDKPYQTNRNQFLVRIGSTNRVATQQELLRLFQQSGVFHYDATPLSETNISELNQTKLNDYFAPYGIDFVREENKISLLKNTDIISESGELTVAGLLIFGIRPQQFLKNASISFAHFKGNDISDELIDKQVIEGSLDYQINTGLSVIKNNWRVPSTIGTTTLLHGATVYEDRVFRELLVNACAHRNYSILGSRIRIFLFDNRIEFRSPGRLPNTVSIEKLAFGVSYASNPVIVKFLENMGFIDKLGRGLPMVVQAARQKGKSVHFEEFGEEFVVVLER